MALCLSNLAACYLGEGKAGKAIPLLERSLSIRERVLGPDHPDVAGSLSTLAAAYSSIRKTSEAEQLLVRALAIREKAFGPNHPDVARNQVSLASIYCGQHRYAEAQELLQQATFNLEKSLTANNPEARACLKQYTEVLRKTHQSRHEDREWNGKNFTMKILSRTGWVCR